MGISKGTPCLLRVRCVVAVQFSRLSDTGETERGPRWFTA